MNLVPSENSAERIERYQALSPGQYWRASREIAEQGIASGLVLLLQSIRWVDDKPHTIILRPHPTMIGKRCNYVCQGEGGKETTHRVSYDEHRFLLADFLDAFEHEPDASEIRAGELAQIQRTVSDLQRELVTAQASPVVLASIALKEAEVRDSKSNGGDQERELTGTQSYALARTGDGTLIAALRGGITPSAVQNLRDAAQREHSLATIQANWIQAKTTAISTAIAAMAPFYEEQAAAALAQTEDVRDYVGRVMQGIESLDLYLGKGVEIQSVREGDSAPASEPLTFVQRKLLMDEEFAVWADIDHRFDFSNEDKFFESLATEDGMVRQIFPTERCVLVMATTRRYIDYGNIASNMMNNAENKRVFLLVRNGGNIYRIWSPVESHLGAARLFPSRDEQERIFKGLDGTAIRFEDVAYTDSLAKHDAFALHFKRFLLLACGLDHRLQLFGSFYPGAPTLDFVSIGFQERYCRFLHDDVGGAVIGQSRQPWEQWLVEQNASVVAGSRVLFNWREVMDPETAPSACAGSIFNERFDRRYEPEAHLGVAVVYRNGRELFVDVEVIGETRATFKKRRFTCKVNLTKYLARHWTPDEIPFICLDKADPEDLAWYIQNRASRANHLQYIRMFKAALRFVVAERATEQPSRDWLFQAMEDGRVGDAAQRYALVNQAIQTWRAGHRGHSLPDLTSSGRDAATARKAILEQLHLLAGEGSIDVARVEQHVLSLGLTPLRLAFAGRGNLVVYAAPSASEVDDRLEPHAWVHRIVLNRSKHGFSTRSQQWTVLPAQSVSENLIHEWSDAGKWHARRTVFLTPDAKNKFLAATQDFQALACRYSTFMSSEEFMSAFAAWRTMRRKGSPKRIVMEPTLAIPFGATVRDGEPWYLAIGSEDKPHVMLWRCAPDDRWRDKVRSEYVSYYANKEVASARFDEQCARAGIWELMLVSSSWPSAQECGGLIHGRLGITVLRLGHKPKWSPLLTDWLSTWCDKTDAVDRVWINPDLNGTCPAGSLDHILGVRLPPDYSPFTVVHVALGENAEEAPELEWIDLLPAPAYSFGTGGLEAVGTVLELSDLAKDAWALIGSRRTRATTTIALSRAEALDKAREIAEARTSTRIISAHDMPQLPIPPGEIERFYIMRGETAAKV